MKAFLIALLVPFAVFAEDCFRIEVYDLNENQKNIAINFILALDTQYQNWTGRIGWDGSILDVTITGIEAQQFRVAVRDAILEQFGKLPDLNISLQSRNECFQGCVDTHGFGDKPALRICILACIADQCLAQSRGDQRRLVRYLRQHGYTYDQFLEWLNR